MYLLHSFGFAALAPSPSTNDVIVLQSASNDDDAPAGTETWQLYDLDIDPTEIHDQAQPAPISWPS
ncbi:MAG: hypothetical protein K2Q15_06365 [Burkholderiales bacterium]|nr:hypothetical protein [Burkholderiales bacterium]